LRLEYGRRIGDLIEGNVALNAIVSYAKTAANDGLAVTRTS
jgi:hypothetical protein